MISARSRGLPAIAVPGDHAWEAQWAWLLAGRRVSVVMDSDHAGRVAAERIAGDLRAAGVHGSIIDLAPGREDGYDLTDWLSEHRDWPVVRVAPRWDPTARRRLCGVAASGQAASDSDGRSSPSFAVVSLFRGRRSFGRLRFGAGEDGADGAVGDVGGGGDVAVGESESRGAFDGLVVVGVGFAFAFGGALDFAEDVGAQLAPGAVFADAFGFGDGAEGGAGADRGAGGVGDAVGVLVGGGGVVAAVGAEPVGGGVGDGVQLR